MKPWKQLMVFLLAVLFSMVAKVPVLAANLSGAAPISGAEIFELHCAGCHINGGNIIRRGKTLKLKALQRNGMDSVEAIAQIVTEGKNNMSAYQDRLTPEQIQVVATYVIDQAQQNWQS